MKIYTAIFYRDTLSDGESYREKIEASTLMEAIEKATAMHPDCTIFEIE